MTAELLGWIGALSAFARTLFVATHDRWSRGRALPAPVQFLSLRVPRWIALRDAQGFTGGALGARGCMSFDAVPSTYTVAVAWQGMPATVAPTVRKKEHFGREDA